MLENLHGQVFLPVIAEKEEDLGASGMESEVSSFSGKCEASNAESRGWRRWDGREEQLQLIVLEKMSLTG